MQQSMPLAVSEMTFAGIVPSVAEIVIALVLAPNCFGVDVTLMLHEPPGDSWQLVGVAVKSPPGPEIFKSTLAAPAVNVSVRATPVEPNTCLPKSRPVGVIRSLGK